MELGNELGNDFFLHDRALSVRLIAPHEQVYRAAKGLRKKRDGALFCPVAFTFLSRGAITPLVLCAFYSIRTGINTQTATI
jgi:hypothetical protein